MLVRLLFDLYVPPGLFAVPLTDGDEPVPEPARCCCNRLPLLPVLSPTADNDSTPSARPATPPAHSPPRVLLPAGLLRRVRTDAVRSDHCIPRCSAGDAQRSRRDRDRAVPLGGQRLGCRNDNGSRVLGRDSHRMV